VTAGVSGRGVGAAADDVQARLADLRFPLEYHVEVLRESTAQEIGAGTVLAVALACLAAAFLLLQAAFRSWRLAALALVALPVALAGGVPAVLVTGAELSLGSLMGFLALFGIAARHGVLLIRQYEHLERDSTQTRGEFVRRGAQDRLAPVLTTAAALVLVALPFVVLGSRPGLEVIHPMAVVLLGGTLSSAFLGLFVLPALYQRFGFGARREPSYQEELWPAPVFGPPAVAAHAAGAPPEPVHGNGGPQPDAATPAPPARG
jgi:Cu/Ag efflux pump CusA